MKSKYYTFHIGLGAMAIIFFLGLMSCAPDKKMLKKKRGAHS